MAWMKKVDRNSKFFHAVIKEKRMRQVTQISKDSGDITSDPYEVGAMASEYYSDLFSASPYHLDNDLFEEIQPVVSKEAVLQLASASAPGNDGFHLLFL